MVEFDIRSAFDELDWKLLRKAIAKHVKDTWCLLYIERWLTAPAVSSDASVVRSLARFWNGHGADNGSRMTQACPIRLPPRSTHFASADPS